MASQAKATELFVASLAKVVQRKANEAKRKMLQKQDVELTTEEIEQLAFLEGTIDTIVTDERFYKSNSGSLFQADDTGEIGR